jgi:hypothetical protein
MMSNVHRWYQPEVGSSTRPDPVRFLVGLSFLDGRTTSLYAEANPLMLVDVLGLYGTNDCSDYDQRCRECGGE